ncbi:MAG: hypothetical protein ACTTJ4_09105 [Treponema sp.]|uniref:hypothetical protein n=1 Tax=Treponema sp. TaxID=166 RepID=UPI003FA2E878
MNTTTLADYSDTKPSQIRKTAETYQHAVEQSDTEEDEEADGENEVDEESRNRTEPLCIGLKKLHYNITAVHNSALVYAVNRVRVSHKALSKLLTGMARLPSKVMLRHKIALRLCMKQAAV